MSDKGVVGREPRKSRHEAFIDAVDLQGGAEFLLQCLDPRVEGRIGDVRHDVDPETSTVADIVRQKRGHRCAEVLLVVAVKAVGHMDHKQRIPQLVAPTSTAEW